MGKILVRIIGLPFIALLFAFWGIKHFFRMCWMFLKYGGEWTMYSKELNPLTVQDSVERMIAKDYQLMVEEIVERKMKEHGILPAKAEK